MRGVVGRGRGWRCGLEMGWGVEGFGLVRCSLVLGTPLEMGLDHWHCSSRYPLLECYVEMILAALKGNGRLLMRAASVEKVVHCSSHLD